MTAVVGILCSDGVVLGTDGSATFADSTGKVFTIEQEARKLRVISDAVLVAGTGCVGHGQRFAAVLKQAYKDDVFDADQIEVGKAIAQRAIADFNETSSPPGLYGALVGFPSKRKPGLCEFPANNFQPELKDANIWFASIGSGQAITDPFLGFIREVFWQAGPPKVTEGVFAAVWTLEHAIALNTGGIREPIQIGVIENVRKGQLKARILEANELGEARQSVEAARNALRRYRVELTNPPDDIEVPEVTDAGTPTG